ncbi:MAG TPA: tetratricopeptide repeat protein [bacterium]|jgi:tetratricopeptide (TPR) repeat protein|nr:tetratricopeptide repeat protein [bacterium]
MRLILSFILIALTAAQTFAADKSKVISYSTFKTAYSAGNDDLKNGRFADAVKAYEAAVGLASTAKGRCDAYNAAGWALMKAKKWPEAKAMLLEAVTEDKDSKIALKNLGFVCFNLYEYGFAGTEELKNAIQYLEASGENEELLDRAKTDLSREEAYAQATPEAEPKLKDKSFKALLAMGDEAQANGKYALATKIFKHAALSASSISSKALVANRLGKVFLDNRKPKEAVLCFEEAVKEKPKEKVYLNNLAYSYWVVYDSGKGTVEDLKKATDTYYRVNSKDSTFHNEMLKMVLEELKEVDPASASQYTVSEDSPETDKPADAKGPGDDGDK